MPENVPPTAAALAEALALSEEILRNLELSELPLSTIALKASRLARLLNDFDYQSIFEFEAGGYPADAGGIPRNIWALAKIAGRVYTHVDKKTKRMTERADVSSIAAHEAIVQSAETSIVAARDRDVSLSSANPQQLRKCALMQRKRRSYVLRSAWSNTDLL